MRMSEVCEMFALDASTIRYYEKIGILGGIKRVSGHRDYGDEDLEKIRLILCLKDAGLSLKAIGAYIKAYDSADSTLDDRVRIIREQQSAIREKIDELKRMSDQLEEKITRITNDSLPKNCL